LDKFVLTAAILGIIGIAMIIAGTMNLRDAPEQEEESTPKRSKKKADKKRGSNMLSNVMFGGSSNMDLKKQGRLRIQIGFVFTVIGLIVAVTYVFN